MLRCYVSKTWPWALFGVGRTGVDGYTVNYAVKGKIVPVLN